MSKLAHSNDETMAIIERQKIASGVYPQDICNLLKFLDSFEYANDTVTVAQVKNALRIES